MSTRKIIHEAYHSKTSKQTKTIKDDNFTYRILLTVINKNLKGKNKRILDIGCGAGTLSFYLANKGHDVLGIDISQKAISECLNSKKVLGLKNLRFQQIDFPNNYPKEKFDEVLFTEVIEHLEDDKKALNAIYRVLRPNGLMILSTPSNKAPLYQLGLVEEFDRKVGHLRRYELNQLKNLVVDAGFKITETRKTEGLLRNFLFVNPYAGKLVRFLNFSGFLSYFVTQLDNIALKLFGESNYIIVAKKV